MSTLLYVTATLTNLGLHALIAALLSRDLKEKENTAVTTSWKSGVDLLLLEVTSETFYSSENSDSQNMLEQKCHHLCVLVCVCV